MNYFDSNRTNTVILKFEAVKVINLLRILKMVKLGIKRWIAKLWLKLCLKISKRNLLVISINMIGPLHQRFSNMGDIFTVIFMTGQNNYFPMVVEILENLVHVSVLGNKDWTTSLSFFSIVIYIFRHQSQNQHHVEIL